MSSLDPLMLLRLIDAADCPISPDDARFLDGLAEALSHRVSHTLAPHEQRRLFRCARAMLLDADPLSPGYE